VERDASPGPPLAGALLTLAGVGLAAAIVLAVHPLREAVSASISGDTAEVRRQVSDLGLAGPLIILALQMIHAVVFYPAELIDAAGGFAYGFFWGFLLLQTGWVISGLLSYGIGQWAGRPLLHRLLGAERFERIEAMIERGGVTLLLTMRLLPIVPFSLISTAAGTARVPVWRFIWTTAAGYAPITAISVYLGTRLESFSFEDPTVLLGIGGMLALIGVAHWLARRVDRTGRGEEEG
jgi:uncharacterized membrane protein YdjX (TVP38/TMEM64 family)